MDLPPFLSSTWESINDISWKLLDWLDDHRIPIGRFFDDHNLPPFLFLLLILAVLIPTVVIISSPAPQPQPVCGDSICDTENGETPATCPQDCKLEEPQGKTVVVELDSNPGCLLSVRLFGAGGNKLGQQSSSDSLQFRFPGITSSSVSVRVSDQYNHTSFAPSITLNEEETIIPVHLSGDFCSQNTNDVGVLRITIKDKSTGDLVNGVSISIADDINGRVGAYRIRDMLVNGMNDFTLPADSSYIVLVEKFGYKPYESSPIRISRSKPFSQTILLEPAETEKKGDLEVCLRSNGKEITSGVIMVEDTKGNRILGDLSSVDPSAEASARGCYVFTDLDATGLVTASVISVPDGCSPTASRTTRVEAGGRTVVVMNLTCTNATASLRLKVVADSRILTENATITLWEESGKLIAGTGVAGSLAYGTNGYTEAVQVPANETIYAWIRALPLGYIDYKTKGISLSKGEHRDWVVHLNYTAPATESTNFTFSGVSLPSPILRNQTFRLVINHISYGDTVLSPDNAKVTAEFLGEKKEMQYDNYWYVNFTAPNTTGDHDLVVVATMGKQARTYTVPVEVREYGDNGLLTITPVFSSYGDPPLTLYYEIAFNGTPVSSITYQSLNLTYKNSPSAFPGNLSSLTREEDHWLLTADVPYAGEYAIKMHVETLVDGVYYNTTYLTTFTATSNSKSLAADVYIPKTVLFPTQAFDVDVRLTFNERPIRNLGILQMYMDGVFYTIPWDTNKRTYHLLVSSPAEELCTTTLKFLIAGEEVAREDISVIDSNGVRAASCPIDREAPCTSIEEVRRCLFNQEQKIAPYPEDVIKRCIKSGCSLTSAIRCPSQNKGDIQPDCKLDEQDVSEMTNYLDSISTQEERNKLADCMDMDNDGDVDKDDLTCLQNIVSGRWYGDKEVPAGENGTCLGSLRGGFCFDIDTRSSVPGDLQYNKRIDKKDEEIMHRIISAEASGVKPPQPVLDAADFNQDGAIDEFDLQCLRGFFSVDYESGEVLHLQKIAPSCFLIFNLDCRGVKGDLDGDGDVTETDLVILKFMEAGVDLEQISPGITACADVNTDHIVDDNDIECMDYLFSGDSEQWSICLDCEHNMPPEAYGEEICHDGYDNNCDGLKDEEDPRCKCNEETPCDMKWDADGGSSPGVDDGNYKVCRDVSWDEVGYKWFSESELECTKERQCETKKCHGREWGCTSDDGEKGEWREKPEAWEGWTCFLRADHPSRSDDVYQCFNNITGEISPQLRGFSTFINSEYWTYLYGEYKDDNTNVRGDDGWNNDCYGGADDNSLPPHLAEGEGFPQIGNEA